MMCEEDKNKILADALEAEGRKLLERVELSYKYPNIHITCKQQMEGNINTLLQAIDCFTECLKIREQ